MLFNDKKCSNCGRYYDPTLNECPKCHNSNELSSERWFPKNIFSFNPYSQIGLFIIGFAYGGMLLLEFIFSLFTAFVSDKELRNLIIISLTYLFMLGALTVVCLTNDRRKGFLKRFTNSTDYTFGIIYAIAIFAFGMLLSGLISMFYKASDNANQTAAVNYVQNYPIIAFFVLCIFGPVCEELTYRVGLYSFLRRIHIVPAIIISVIFFALIHFDFTNINADELIALPSYIASGLILTVAYEHRGPACSITAHLLYNSLAFIMIAMGV